MTGEYTIRATRDFTDNFFDPTLAVNVRTPFTIVLNFSQDIFMDELIIGSLSFIRAAGGGYENATVRAFDGPNGTGNTVFASRFDNISALSDDLTLLHNQGVTTCDPVGPINALANVNMDPDLSYTPANGAANNLGTAADDGIYRAIGVGEQIGGNIPISRYGRVLLAWQTTPIRSIAFSTWVTPGPNDFGNPIYTSGFHSVTFAPFTFSLPPTPPGGGGGDPRDGDPSEKARRLPANGFAPGVLTRLPAQPAELVYKKYGDLTVEVPSLGVDLPILGVPLEDGEWNTDWLLNQASYLSGTAFPTWQGNPVLTSHVTWANGLPGPFANIHSLKWGDEIVVNAWGQRFIYEVRTVKAVRPWNLSVIEKDDGYDWVTLLTRSGYDERSDSYLWRTAVQAALVDVEDTR